MGLPLDPMPDPLGGTSCQRADLPVGPGHCVHCPDVVWVYKNGDSFRTPLIIIIFTISTL